MRTLSPISLNATETQIKEVLVDFCHHYNRNHTPPLELRITGGWVRDKLLGNESHDIDIAIDHMSGEDFATQLTEWLHQTKPDLVVKALHTIKKNPEKLKHLETCTTKLFGCDIDFVNLRLETYGDDSRVPTVEFGTAEQDALRRDATLNALFYNLNQEIIEDFTGRGMEDLRQGILRTPLPPKQTFLDDPLRVLRLIRFACRFQFTLDLETVAAMAEPEIKLALHHKISRERVGIEIEKILECANPEYGLQLINYLQLAPSIFNAGELQSIIDECNPNDEVTEVTNKFTKLGHQINIATAVFKKYHREKLFSSSHDQKLFWLAVILAPLGASKVRIHKKKDVKTLVVQVLLREGVKYGNKDNEVVATFCKLRETCRDELEGYLTGVDEITTDIKTTSLESSLRIIPPQLRSRLGLYLRQFGDNAHLNLQFNCFADIIDALSLCEIDTTLPNPSEAIGIEPELVVESTINKTIERYNRLRRLIASLGLNDVHLLKPILDGKQLLMVIKKSGDEYKKVKGGQWMSPFMNDLLQWQLDHPGATETEATEWVKLEIPKRNFEK